MCPAPNLQRQDLCSTHTAIAFKNKINQSSFWHWLTGQAMDSVYDMSFSRVGSLGHGCSASGVRPGMKHISGLLSHLPQYLFILRVSMNNGISPFYNRLWERDSSVGKESAHNAGNPGLIPGSGRSTGEGIGYPFHKNQMIRVPRYDTEQRNQLCCSCIVRISNFLTLHITSAQPKSCFTVCHFQNPTMVPISVSVKISCKRNQYSIFQANSSKENERKY